MIARSQRSVLPLAFLLAVLVLILRARPAYALTAAGVPITNTSSVTFSDTGNSYTAASNTITAYVQNVATLTVTAPSNQNVTPSMIVVDTFTLTNTGNASGKFALSPDAVFSGTASAPSLKGYILTGGPGTCTIAAPCALSTLNAQTAMASVAMNGTAIVGVEYQVSSGSTNTQTIITTLHATITNPLLTGAIAATSVDTTNAPIDAVVTDARLDVQTTVVAPTSGVSTIAWTVKANNGGGNPALNLASAQAALSAVPAAVGVAIFVPLPVFGGTYLLLNAQPAAPTLSGASVGAAAVLYYNAAACATSPTTGWAITGWAVARCVAVYISGGASGVELPSATGGSTGAGAVGTPQITLNFATNQPAGTGAANANAVTLLATGAIGGVVWATGSTPILGQGVAMGTVDAATASLLNGIQTNATSSSGAIAPGGASNSIGSAAFASYIVDNAPYHSSDITGWYPGAAAVNSSNDFTALNVVCTSNGSSGVNGLLCTVGTNIILVNTVKNEGNVTDAQVKLTALAPSGWKVQLYNVTGCSATLSLGYKGGSCIQGTSITAQSTDGGSVNGVISMAAATAVDYEAVYNATGSATPFTVYDAKVTAAGQNGAGTGVDTNDTHNDLIPGGVVKLTNAISVTTTGCPTGESPGNLNVCPGGTLSHTIAYANIIPTAVGANLGTEPTFAYNACYTSAGGLLITDDGAANPSGATFPNNWSTTTNAIKAAASDTTSNTVITYYPSASTTFSANQTKLTALIGGASYQLAPGGSGTISFDTVVK